MSETQGPEAKKAMTEAMRKVQEEEAAALASLPSGTKAILDLYTNRVHASMDALVERVTQQNEPRFTAIEDSAKALESRVTKLEKQFADSASSAGGGSSTGDWKPSNIVIKICEFKDKDTHKVNFTAVRNWVNSIKTHLGTQASELGGLKARTTEDIYKVEIPVNPAHVESIKDAMRETMTSQNLAIRTTAGVELWPKINAEQHPIRMMRYRTYGSLVDAIQAQAKMDGYVVKEDWQKSLSVEVG
eukprot:9493809-Pyramimonas_sp.AAC.1